MKKAMVADKTARPPTTPPAMVPALELFEPYPPGAPPGEGRSSGLLKFVWAKRACKEEDANPAVGFRPLNGNLLAIELEEVDGETGGD